VSCLDVLACRHPGPGTTLRKLERVVSCYSARQPSSARASPGTMQVPRFKQNIDSPKCSNTKMHSFKVTTHKENARLYIGGEGRPGSTITRKGQPGSNSYRASPVPAAGAGRARVVIACWDSSPTLARGPCRARHGHGTDRVVSFSGRV
jgi:hypothetical protein